MAIGLKKKKGTFLITGGAGFIGSHLCREFLDYKIDESGLFASSNEVICLDNFSKGDDKIFDLLGKPGFEVINSFDVIPENLNIAYILHFASYPSPKDHLAMPIKTLRADSIGTMKMLELANEKNAVYMLASTGHIDQENDPTNEKGVYCEGKRWAEAYTMAYHRCTGLETRIIRMFGSYGPGMRIDDGRVVPAFISKALRNERLSVNGGSQLISLTYIDDMVDAIKCVLFSDMAEPVEIGSPYRIPIGELAQLIIKLSKSHSKLDLNPQTAKDEKLPDLQRARKLGWSPKVDITEGIGRTIEYFRERI